MPGSSFRSARSYLITATVAILTACAGTPATDAIPAISRVLNGDWELTTSSFVESGRMPGLARAKITFRDGHMSAFSGCNSATAIVREADGRLESSNLMKSDKACPQPVGAFDSRFFRLLRAQPVYRVEGDVLTLAANDQTARFRRIQ